MFIVLVAAGLRASTDTIPCRRPHEQDDIEQDDVAAHDDGWTGPPQVGPLNDAGRPDLCCDGARDTCPRDANGRKIHGQVDNQTPQPPGPNAVRIKQTVSGMNQGPGTPLDGAKVRWVETVTLKDGQGPVQASITFTTPSGATSSAYTGTATTDPQGRVTAQGTYQVTQGTGELAGVTGTGTFSVAYTSKTDFTGARQGEIQLPGQPSSKR
ncbi:Ig-like domain-containing protein [Methylobacterium soli]|uniref:Ig-like domain-containing protein n=1 Tax=Methylobacterium soli TaxID=553447 RepID=UPI001EE26EAA|nr:Ig-like domain-containing protein [Methylobacterium soli]GJE45648.1 hypothetical protein AEGHOMDF_4848 [Methylobacterium soli]